jgi:hypothetical protein
MEAGEGATMHTVNVFGIAFPTIVTGGGGNANKAAEKKS